MMFESVLKVCRISHLPKSQFGPDAFAELPRMSLLYQYNRKNLIHLATLLYLYMPCLLASLSSTSFLSMIGIVEKTSTPPGANHDFSTLLF